MGDAPLRFVYQIRPLSTIVQRAFCAAFTFAFAIWSWQVPLMAGICVVIGIGMLIWLGVTKTVLLIVQGETLLVIRRPLMRLFGTFEQCESRDVRTVRYHSEIRENMDADGTDDMRYYLDLILKDSSKVTLMTTLNSPLRRAAGRQLAEALGAKYEEYLAEG